jgi:dTDP-4-dehydrorhamnose 3,5-epimerase
VVKAALYDRREDSATRGELMEILMGDQHPAKLVKIPPGVAHGYRVLQGPAHVFYITSNIYNPNDEGRIPHDDPAIGYDWLAGPEIK